MTRQPDPPATCLHCATPEGIPGARFCVACGEALRMKCEGCGTWNLLGGASLNSDGRCPGCGRTTRACALVKCGRLHGPYGGRCDCALRKVMPRREAQWASFGGPLEGVRCVEGRPLAGTLFGTPRHLPSDRHGDALGFLECGELWVAATSGLVSSESDDVVAASLAGAEPVAGPDDVYLPSATALHQVAIAKGERHKRPFHPGTYVAQTLGPEGWIGLLADGSFRGDRVGATRLTPGSGRPLSASTADEAAFLWNGQLALIPEDGDLTISPVPAAGRAVALFYGPRGSDGSPRLYALVGEPAGMRVIALTPGIAWQSSGLVGDFRPEPIVGPDGVVHLLPQNGGEIGRIRLSDGVADIAPGRLDQGRVLAGAGLWSDGALRLIAVQTGPNGASASVVDPASGSAVALRPPTGAWTRAFLLVHRDDGIRIGYATDHISGNAGANATGCVVLAYH